MQLRNKDLSIMVDFFPTYIGGTSEISETKFLKRITFQNGQVSESVVNKRDMEREANERVCGYGYKCVGFNETIQRINFFAN